jgi:MtrB/PioB family decaheme-associated outer membrane protein
MSKKITVELKLAPIAAALLLAFGSAYAQQGEDVKALVSPDGASVTIGGGGVSAVKQANRLGQYTGLNKDGVLLLDFESVKRDEVTGTWMTLTGRDLGLDTREFGVTVNKQGDWKLGFDYNEIVRNDPYVIHTGMTGIGSSSPVINLISRPAMPALWATQNGYAASNGVEGHDEQLKLKRTAFGLTGEKWISPTLQLEMNFRNEDKKGARMFGRVGIGSGDMGSTPNYSATASVVADRPTNGGWALLLTPEPIDSNIRTIETRLNFNLDKLALSGGYLGSFYTNNSASLTPVVPGTLNRGVLGTTCTSTSIGACQTIQQISSSAVALPPDNQAHQVYFSGTYAYSDTTKTNFKLSFTHATQDENFVGVGLTPAAAAPASLGGVVDTTLAQLGLSLRPIKDLSVNASLRYEDRADKTAVNVYNTNGITGSPLNNGNNWPSNSQTRTTAKVDGIYRLTGGYSANMGLEWEARTNPLPALNTPIFNKQVFFREALTETGVRAGLRKAMSESLNGAIGIEYKQRRGNEDAWRTGASTGGGVLQVSNPSLLNNVLADMYMDRDRTKVRGSVDWAASDTLDLEVVAEWGQDDYKRSSPVVAGAFAEVAGARVVGNSSLTFDASYNVAGNWYLNGYWTHSENRWKVNKVSLADDTRNNVDTIGLGVKGKIGAQTTVGMDLTSTNDVSSYYNMPATGNAAGWSGQVGTVLPANYLPTITYTTTKLNLYGNYDIDKKSAIKVNVAYQELKSDDWQWGYNGVPFVYSDNTTVSNPNQAVTFIGAAFIHKF